MRIFNFAFILIIGIFLSGVIAEVYSSFDIASYVPNLQPSEAAMWNLIPLAILMIFFVLAFAALVLGNRRRKDD